MPQINRDMKVARSIGLPNISWRDLIKRSRAKIRQFEKEFDKYPTPDGPYYFKDNGADILAVANLDWLKPPLYTAILPLDNDREFYCPTLSSRAGVYTVVDYLPQIMKSSPYDILLTTGKEKGQSSARYFHPPMGKKYKWIFSFEQEGTDAAAYQYYNDDIADRLERTGWTVQAGLYSDIIDLEHLRCKAIDFGVGVFTSFTKGLSTNLGKAYLSRNAFMRCMTNFMRFWKENKDIALLHTPIYNSYVIGKGFMYYEDRTKNTRFTAEEMEIIDILENLGYEFPDFVTMIFPEDMPDVIAAYQRAIANRNYLNEIKQMRESQLELFNVEHIQKMYDQARSRAITGSEDHPDYKREDKRRHVIVSKSPRKESSEPKTLKDVGFTVTHIPKVEENMFSGNLVDECTTCHKPYEFDPKSGKTQCPDCLGTKEDVDLFHNLTSSSKKVKVGPGPSLTVGKEKVYEYDESKPNWYETGEEVEITNSSSKNSKRVVFVPRRTKKQVSV